jgi:hypothetical protein
MLLCKFLCCHGGVAKCYICLEYDTVSLDNQILVFHNKFAIKLQANAGNFLSDLIQQRFSSMHVMKIHIWSYI